jgi:hypothetical protein
MTPHSIKWLGLFPLLVLSSAFLLFATENHIAVSIPFYFCLLLPNFMALDSVLNNKTSNIFYVASIISLVGAIVFCWNITLPINKDNA